MATLQDIKVGNKFKFRSSSLSFKRRTVLKLVSDPDLFGEVRVQVLDNTSKYGSFAKKGNIYEVPVKSIVCKA